jgi:hypothetical protein
LKIRAGFCEKWRKTLECRPALFPRRKRCPSSAAILFLRCSKRFKEGKPHHDWSIVENKRMAGGKVVPRHGLYLGEIHDCQRDSWRKSIEVFEDGEPRPRTVALFPEERHAPADDAGIRPAPPCPWWRFVWSQRASLLVADDGTVPVRSLRLSIDAPPRSRVIRCLRFDGDIFFLKSHPKHGSLPAILLHSPPF